MWLLSPMKAECNPILNHEILRDAAWLSRRERFRWS
jgi:hypothetical protein